MTAFILGVTVGVLLMVCRVNAGYDTGSENDQGPTGDWRNTQEKKMDKNKMVTRLVGRTRRGKTVRLVAVLLLIPTIAFAAVLALSVVKGRVSVKEMPQVSWATTATYTTTGGTYTPTLTGDAVGTVKADGHTIPTNPTQPNLSIDVTEAYPGHSFDIEARVWTTAANLRLQGVDLGNGVTAEVVKTANSVGCGETLARHTSGAPTPVVKFRVTVPAGTAPGDITLPTQAGLKAVVGTGYDAALCKQVTG